MTAVREHMHEAIQASTHHDSEIDGAIVLGWVCVVEWMHPTGDRWLSRLSGTATGDREMSPWTMQGYLHNALNDWPDDEDDGDEE